MRTTLTSRERLRRAFRHQPVDHIPLLLRFWSLGGESDNIPFNWREEISRVRATTALGLDDTLLLEPPLGYVENYHAELLHLVTSETEILPPQVEGEAARLRKTYHTPAGDLQTCVRLSDDWPRGQDIHLFDDYNLSRLCEPLIKSTADLEPLKFLLGDPTPAQVLAFQERAAILRKAQAELGVILDGGWVALGDALMWLVGMERVLYGQSDEPDFLDAVLEVIFEWEMKRIELLLQEGIDVLVHMAWYESTDFWTPKMYRRLIKPRLRQEIARAHTHGAAFRYIITRSWQPYRTDFVELGIDCLTGVDPVQDRLDLKAVKQELGKHLCLMGGVNSAVMLSQWEPEQIQEAVFQALETMAAGSGFILYPVDAIFNVQPWEKVEHLIQAWKTWHEKRAIEPKEVPEDQ